VHNERSFASLVHIHKGIMKTTNTNPTEGTLPSVGSLIESVNAQRAARVK